VADVLGVFAYREDVKNEDGAAGDVQSEGVGYLHGTHSPASAPSRAGRMKGCRKKALCNLLVLLSVFTVMADINCSIL
jgi:hypothetical protein